MLLVLLSRQALNEVDDGGEASTAHSQSEDSGSELPDSLSPHSNRNTERYERECVCACVHVHALCEYTGLTGVPRVFKVYAYCILP